MCFSNLPIEFDEQGNPYLAEEADEVADIPDDGCGCADDLQLEDDPEAVFADVVETLPAEVQERLVDGNEPARNARRPPAEGD